jgi:signal transduction histidine kinase
MMWSLLGGAIARWLAVCAVLATVLVPTAGTASGPPKRVLILHSYGREFPPFSDISRWFRDELVRQSPGQVDVYEASLESARFSEGEHERPFVDYLLTLFSHRDLDLVVCIGGPASRFAQRRRSELFASTPMLFLGVNQKLVLGAGATSKDAVVPVRIDLPIIVENILRTVPETDKIAVVIGNSPLEKFWLSEMQREFAQFNDRVEFAWLNDLSFGQMRKRVSSLPPRSAILFAILYIDADGVPQDQGRALAILRDEANAPIFGAWEDEVGRGIVGGPVVSARELGRRAAGIAKRIFQGDTDIGEAAAVGPDTLAYDWRELRRWAISEKRLPSGSDIRFRSPAAWEQYRWQIVGAISLVLLQSLLITVLFFERARRRTAEMDSRKKESDLRVSYDQVRELAGRLINAQEDERTRIARELHDDVGQRVASLSIGLSSLKRRVSDSDETLRSELTQLQQQTTGLAEELRDLSHELHQGALEHVGLPEALRERCDQINGQSDTQVKLEVADGWTEVADDIKLCLYRVAQEALHNIAKHAQAKMGCVAIAHQNGQVVMRISDNGLGFATHGPAGQQGIGLLSMRERVRMLGGSFEVKSERNTGTIATVTIPTGGKH